MSGNPRTAQQVYAATLLLILSISGSFASTQDALTSFTVPWGDAPDQLGLVKGPEIEPLGPLTFAVSPQDEIFVADTVHHVIKRYRNDGTFAGVVAENLRPTAMTFDSQGRLLLLWAAHVFILTEGGGILAEINLPQNLDIVEGYGQDILEEEGFIAVNNPDELTYLFRADEPSPTTATRILLGRQGTGGKRLLVTSVRGRVGAYELPVERALPKELSTTTKLESYRLADFTEMSRRAAAWQGGVLYKGWLSSRRSHVFETDAVQGSQIRLWLRVVASDGRVISRELPNDYLTTVYKKTELRPDGSAWQMLTTPAGVRFIRWRLPE